jgi:acetylglutamate kinase
MKTPKGFSFAGMNAGIKAARKDFALVASDVPASCAGAFTINKARAAGVNDAAARLPSTTISAVVLNSGNANSLTGPSGEDDARAVQSAVAKALDVPAAQVVSCSTGVIGVRLPVKKLVDAAPALVGLLGHHIESAAEAVFTTDTRVKLAHRTLAIGGKEICIAGFAKGSGMVAPQLATMLAVLTTDASLEPAVLKACLDTAIDGSFHNLVVDGEMSTNDAVFALANGRAGGPPIALGTREFSAFLEAFTAVCVELARAIAEDGEGATKLLEVKVEGALDAAMARDLAKSVCGSNLVKACVFGADPNWGRILASVGARAGARDYPIDPTKATVMVQGLAVYRDGAPTGVDGPALRAKMREPQVCIVVTLVEGDANAVAWGCDLSYDYVKINADYMSFTTASASGVVQRDDRLTNYSPAFKRSLVVEALSYISRFTGRRAVIKYGGAAMVKDSLKASFANDVNLLRSAGLLPIVVHGGGPEIAKTLEALGQKSQIQGGVRITTADDVEVLEMVLSGKINSELVSLLNQDKPQAVGLSGKDAGLLRAKKRLGEGGGDLGMEGDITSVNRELVEMLLEKHYVPVISPIALGEDGGSYNLNADTVAAELAIALGAEKLVFLTNVPGILEAGELVSELSANTLRNKIETGVVTGGMAAKGHSALRALDGGVKSVHVIDGRTPHSLIAELFTDRGVGTLIVRD